MRSSGVPYAVRNSIAVGGLASRSARATSKPLPSGRPTSSTASCELLLPGRACARPRCRRGSRGSPRRAGARPASARRWRRPRPAAGQCSWTRGSQPRRGRKGSVGGEAAARRAARSAPRRPCAPSARAPGTGPRRCRARHRRAGTGAQSRPDRRRSRDHRRGISSSTIRGAAGPPRRCGCGCDRRGAPSSRPGCAGSAAAPRCRRASAAVPAR